jgi:hypothetical protein
MQALVDEAVRENQTPLQYVLGVMNNPAESPERRLAAAAIGIPYCHPRYTSIEARVEVAAEVGISRAELAARAEREIAEAFREWEGPVIEHASADEPATLPSAPQQPEEPVKPPREFAAPGPLAVDASVTRLPQRYRPRRPIGGGWSG